MTSGTLRAAVLVSLLVVLPEAPARTQAVAADRVTSPRAQFGADIGDDYFLATLGQFEEYWRRLDRESDRMTVVEIGKTEEGRSQLMAIVSAPENLRRLDRYREISRRLALAGGLTDGAAQALAHEGRAIVWVSGGLHANETLGVQQMIELVYQLVSRNDPETQRIRRDVIVLAVHANPDGHALVGDWYMREPVPTRRTLAGIPRLYQKYAGHDINRDFYMSTQAETVNMNRVLYREWFPQIVYDHHQTGPPGTVMFAPPFNDPSNYVFDPLILAGVERLGAAMHRRFAAEEKRGVTMRAGSTYSMWWNGGLRTTAYFHNQLGLLTETIGEPAPTDVPFVAARQTPSAHLPLPIAPQPWHFRQSVEYSMTANRAVLDAASRERETLLLNAYRMGRNSIERGGRDTWTATPRRPIGRSPDPRLRDPRGYILPSDQPDFLTATKFVNTLLRAGVAVQRAQRSFTVDGVTYPAGSFVVKTAQAFRPHVLDMFEPQDHPDDVPERAPAAPYDSAGWTLAFQMGVGFVRVLDGFNGPFEAVTGEVTPTAGRISGPARPAGYLVSHRQNDAFIAVNRLLAAGEKVFWLKDRDAGGAAGTGVMYVPAGRATLRILEGLARGVGLSFTGVARAPGGEALGLRPVRVALVDEPGGSVASGWTRWLLERFEFAFDVVELPSVAGLRPRYDVWILPSDVTLTRAATRTLRSEAEGGATVLAVGGATSSLSRDLDLSVDDALAEPDRASPPARRRVYVPGSVLRVSVDNTSPLAYGFERTVDVFFDQSPVFRIASDATPQARRVAWFSDPAPLRSGWARGQQHLAGGAAAVDVAVGRGRVVLFGPEITFRAQPHGTFKFLFNGIYYGSAAPVRF